MTNMEKYEKAFIDAFDVPASELPALTYQAIPSWDSVGHMSLMAAIEEAFGITMDIDDIIDFSGFLKGWTLLKKYGVEL
jgi:acyl carrier protein